MREQIRHRMHQRPASRLAQGVAVACELGGAADPDAVAQAGDRHLERLVHHGADRGAHHVGHRHRDGVALHRIHRQHDPRVAQQRRRVAAEGHHILVGGQGAGCRHHAGNPAAVHLQPLDVGAVAKDHPGGFGQRGQVLREDVRVAGLVPRQAQATHELARDIGQRRFLCDAAGAVQHGVGHAEPVEHRGVVAGVVGLRLGAEQLQQAALALVVGDAGDAAQVAQPVAAVLRQPHHARLVAGIGLRVAVAEKAGDPVQQLAVGHRPEYQWPVAHHQPEYRLLRGVGSGPRRRQPWRDLPRIGKAGLHPGRRLPVEDRYLMARLREIPGRCDTDDAAAENDHFQMDMPHQLM